MRQISTKYPLPNNSPALLKPIAQYGKQPICDEDNLWPGWKLDQQGVNIWTTDPLKLVNDLQIDERAIPFAKRKCTPTYC